MSDVKKTSHVKRKKHPLENDGVLRIYQKQR